MKEMIYGGTNGSTYCLLNDIYRGYEFAILNVRGSHPCAYICLPEDHYWADTAIDGDYDEIDLPCHGGLTFASDHLNLKAHLSDDKKEYIVDESKPGAWIGWDYAHYTDYTYMSWREEPGNWERKWTTEEVLDEVTDAIDELIEEDRRRGYERS